MRYNLKLMFLLKYVFLNMDNGPFSICGEFKLQFAICFAVITVHTIEFV